MYTHDEICALDRKLRAAMKASGVTAMSQPTPAPRTRTGDRHVTQNEIRSFENNCIIERREDGFYIRHNQVSDFAGPYADAIDALRYYRLVWAVE